MFYIYSLIYVQKGQQRENVRDDTYVALFHSILYFINAKKQKEEQIS